MRFLQGVDLLQDAVAEHRDPLAEGHRLDLVVGDVDGRDAEPLVQLGELGAHRDPELRVENFPERLRLAPALARAARARTIAAQRSMTPRCK